MTKKQLLKQIKKLQAEDIVIRIEDGLYYPVNKIYTEGKTVVIEGREVNLQKGTPWVKV